MISFHSLEDRIVKSHFNNVDLESLNESLDKNQITKKSKNQAIAKFKMNSSFENLDSFTMKVKKPWTQLTKKILEPSQLEIEKNPRARSAKLRVAIKN